MSLWDDPTLMRIKAELPDDVKKDYELKGELLYNSFDYVNGVPLDNDNNKIQELLMMINSGLRYSDLDEDDLQLLSKFYTDEDIRKLTKHN